MNNKTYLISLCI